MVQLTLALMLLTCRVNCRGIYLMRGTLRTKKKPLGYSRLLASTRIIERGASQIKFNEAKAVVTKLSQYGQTFEQKIPVVGTNG